MARVSTKLPGVVITAKLKQFGATVEKLEEITNIPKKTIDAIIEGTEPVTAELSVKLGRALDEKDRYFAELQLTHDVIASAKDVGKIAKLRKPAGRPGRKPGVKAAVVATPPAKRGRKPGVKAVVVDTLPAKRGRKPGVKAVVVDTPPAKRGRKPGVKAADAVPAKRGRKPGVKNADTPPARRGRPPRPKTDE
jgi:plasmid maintenance system antidote protein VapI